MTIASEISRLQLAKTCLKNSLEAKGISVNNSDLISVYYCYIDNACILVPKVIDFLLVGGGGGGGNTYGTRGGGGGGGAGGLIHCENYSAMPGGHSIVIGQGGNAGESGGDSCFGNLIAYGGGAGGSETTGCIGGSGGGGAGKIQSPYGCGGGTGCSGQGYSGGNGCYFQGGGGGGYLGNGTDGQSNGTPGVGGAGYCSDIAGVNCIYSYGGGGGGANYGGDGSGHGDGNNGGGTNAQHYGGGGGGARGNNYNYNGYSGCQGIFIARYPTSCGYNITGGCKYTCGSYTIHCFTSDGTLIIN